LNAEEKEVNARYIYNYLRLRGWSPQAICGMLGNMETESYLNPGVWENLDPGDDTRGFGLVQWTPSTKYTDWCYYRELDPSHMDSALMRIEYEVENGLQWIKTKQYNYSFEWFKTSTSSPSSLAQAFLYNYERPLVRPQPLRSAQALKWYNKLKGGSIDPGGIVTNTSRKMGVLMIIAATRRRF